MSSALSQPPVARSTSGPLTSPQSVSRIRQPPPPAPPTPIHSQSVEVPPSRTVAAAAAAVSPSESADVLSSLSVSRRAAGSRSDGRPGGKHASPASSPSSSGSHSRDLVRANRERAALSAAAMNKSQSMQEQMSAYMKKTALVVSERVEDGAAVMVKALRGPEHDQSAQIDDAQLASLDYDNFLDYVYDKQLEEDEASSRRHRISLLLLRFAITVLIAFVTAMLMYFVNTVVRWASAKRIDTTVQLIATGYSAAAYFSFVFASIAITAVASFMCTVIAPHARGGGVPYLFAYLNGTNVYEYFTFRILAVKVCALAFTIAGGLTLGMEGPFVYIGGGVALLLSNVWDLVPNVSSNGKYTRILRNINEERVFMACGLAAGLSVAFSAPIAGILFAMEGAVSFLTINTVLRIFGCSMFALFFKDLSMNGWSAHIKTTNLITIQPADVNYAWLVPEVLAFTLMAVLGGALGAVAVHLNVKITKWRHHYMGERIAGNMTEVALITGVTASVMFVLPLMFGCSVMPPFCADDSDTRCQSLFCPLGRYSEIGSIVFSSSDIIARNLFDRNIAFSNEYDVFPLLVYMMVYVFLVAWVYGAYVPGGLFVPSIVIGGCYGRVVGHIGHAYVSTSINPGVYALLGAAGMLGGFTRLGLPVVVMLVEMTGDATYLLPIMYVATLAKLLADWIEPPLYPQHMAIESISQLGDKIPLAIAQLTAADIANRTIHAVHDIDTLGHLLDTLDDTKAKTLPVTDEQGRFIGQITRASLAYAIQRSQLFATKEAAIRGKRKGDGDRSTAAAVLNVSGGSSGGGGGGGADSELLATGGRSELLQAGAGMGDWHSTSDYTATVKGELSDLHLHYFINLRPLIDSGVFTVQQQTSNKRIHSMLRRMGYSHLFVVDQQHRLVGTITRRQLITLESNKHAPPATAQQHDEQQQQQREQDSKEGEQEEEEKQSSGWEQASSASRDQQPAGVQTDKRGAVEEKQLTEEQKHSENESTDQQRRSVGRSTYMSAGRAAYAAETPSQQHIEVSIATHTPPPGLGRRTTLQRIQMLTKDLK